MNAVGRQRIRAVTHLDVSLEQIQHVRAADAANAASNPRIRQMSC